MNDNLKSQLDKMSERINNLQRQIMNTEVSEPTRLELVGERDQLRSLHDAMIVIHVDLPNLLDRPIANRRG